MPNARCYIPLALVMMLCAGATEAAPNNVAVNACTDGWSYLIDNSGDPALSLGLQGIDPGNIDIDFYITSSVAKATLLGHTTAMGYSLTLKVPEFGAASTTQVFNKHQLVRLNFSFDQVVGSETWTLHSFSLTEIGRAC